MSIEFDPAPISEALVAARRSCKPLDGFPGDVPASLDQAYAVQKCSIKAWDAPLVGFKVGGVPPEFREQYPANWQVGPIFADQVYQVESGQKIDVSVFPKGFAAYEAEFVFVLEGMQDLSGPFDGRADVVKHISSIHLGAEIASSPNPKVNLLGPGSIISDFGNNAGLVLGPEHPASALESLMHLDVTLHIDGELIGSAQPAPFDDGPLGALQYLLRHLTTVYADMELPDKIYVSSGAITGVHQSQIGTTAQLRFGELAEYELSMIERVSSLR